MAMEAVVETVVSFVREHEAWAGPISFLVSFGESFCFLSLIIPGTAILVGIAALLAYSGVSDAIILPAIIGAALGGALGYAVSYWIGIYFKDSIHKIWPFSTRPYLITRGQEFFEKYGVFGVFLGHFFGPVRAVIPVVAGMFRMAQLPFQIANIASATLWSAGVILPAFYLVTNKKDVLAYLAGHELIVAAALALLAVANAIPRPLFFVPTLALFVGVGALHIFAGGSFPVAWLAGALGAFVGDIHAYFTGKRHQGNLRGAWPFTATAGSRQRAREFIARHGVSSILRSKAMGFNRGLVPLIAGANEMPLLPFMGMSALSALIWSAALLLPALLIVRLFA